MQKCLQEFFIFLKFFIYIYVFCILVQQICIHHHKHDDDDHDKSAQDEDKGRWGLETHFAMSACAADLARSKRDRRVLSLEFRPASSSLLMFKCTGRFSNGCKDFVVVVF